METDNALKPVGSVYWYEFPINLMKMSGDAHIQTRFLYKVVKHDSIARFTGDKVGIPAENVIPVRMQKRRITKMTSRNGSLDLRNTDNWEFEFTEWQDV